MEELKSKENAVEESLKENTPNETNKEVRTGIRVFIVVIILIAFIIFMMYVVNEKRNSLKFELQGEAETTIEVGTNYEDLGVIAEIEEKDFNNKVHKVTNLNTQNVGAYYIQYNMKIFYLGINKQLTRKINVIDTTPPELIINCDENIEISIGEEYAYPSYTAIDNYDGDITNNVITETDLDTNKNGIYQIKYTVADSSENITTRIINVTVKKNKNAHIVVYISKQKLEYYEYDRIVLSSDIVTGINGKTPTGNYKILSKATNIVLKGEDYESFVNYWMAFIGHSYGFHDASWQSKFGGDVYKTRRKSWMCKYAIE